MECENDTVRGISVSCLETLADDQSILPAHSSQDETFRIENSLWRTHSDHRSPASTTSSSSTASRENATVEEMRFTMTSNFLFFLSSTIQSIMAMGDLRYAKAKILMDDDGKDETYVYSFGDKVYYFFFSLAPFLCLMSAILDVQHFGKLYTTTSWWLPSSNRLLGWFSSRSNASINNEYHCIVQVEYKREPEIHENDNESISTVESDVKTTTSAHWQLGAAIVFGIAATLELYCTLLYDYYEDTDYWDDDSYLIEEENKRKWYVSNYRIDFIGMHLYLLSGILALISQHAALMSHCTRLFYNTKKECETKSSDGFATALTVLGTTFFISGTLMDCTIAWLSDPLLRHDLRVHMEPVTLSRFSLTSCLLWSIDAVFYIWADVLVYSLHDRESEGREWLSRSCCWCNSSEEGTSTEEKKKNARSESILVVPNN